MPDTVQGAAPKPPYTLLECRPITGRKHQIRRHARIAGHAVVGDARYGTPQSIRHLQDMKFRRMGLHAMSITLVLPGTLEPATLSSRKIPPEILHLLERDLLENSSNVDLIR